MKNENIELLKFIFQNSQMGLKAIHQLLTRVTDSKMISLLENQIDKYFIINQKAEYLLYYLGEEEENIKPRESFMAYMSINIQTIINNSSEHIAQMMLNGSLMGIIDIIKNLKKYQKADRTIIEIMEELKSIEIKNMEDLFTFLKEIDYN